MRIVHTGVRVRVCGMNDCKSAPLQKDSPQRKHRVKGECVAVFTLILASPYCHSVTCFRLSPGLYSKVTSHYKQYELNKEKQKDTKKTCNLGYCLLHDVKWPSNDLENKVSRSWPKPEHTRESTHTHTQKKRTPWKAREGEKMKHFKSVTTSCGRIVWACY